MHDGDGRHSDQKMKNGQFDLSSSSYTFYFTYNKTANIIKQNWNQFLLVVKATALNFIHKF